MRLEIFDGLGLAVFNNIEILFVEARDGCTFLVGNDHVDENIADIDLERRGRRRIVDLLGRCGGRREGEKSDCEKSAGRTSEHKHG